MLFPIPDPTYWDDPGPLPINRLHRWVFGLQAEFWPISQGWVDQWKRYTDRQNEIADAYNIWLDQAAAYEQLQAEYAAEGDFLAERLPVYLHHLGLSYRRTVRERKEDRPYEKIDYCEIETWHWDEYAYYFWIQSWPLPYGLKIGDFQPAYNDGTAEAPTTDNDIAQSLAAAVGSHVMIEFNPRGHERQGLWIIIEHKRGRGKIPLRVSYQTCLAEMPKTASPLAFPLGHGVNNQGYIIDLGEVTNLLIGGSQGGGKSNILNVMLSTFITRNSPQVLRLFLCDFKRVEFAFYRGIAHLGGDAPYIQKMTEDKDGNPKPGPMKTFAADYQPKDGIELKVGYGGSIITEGEELVKLLTYALAEVERRTIMLEGKVRKIDTWNKRYPNKKLSRWVIVIDELADVMLQPKLKTKVEPVLIRIAQLGRAMGIHLILATQTPKNEVITMLIQNNIINRIVFRCGTGIASGVMLDGKYDAARLFPNPGRAIFREASRMIELQTPEITELSTRQAVRTAQDGKTEHVIDQKKYTVAPEIIFEYALQELGGYCSSKDLYNAFKTRRVPRLEIEDLLKSFEVAGTYPGLEPEIPIGENEYYLAPSPGGQQPRQLIAVNLFTAQFDNKWRKILASRVPRPVETAPPAEGEGEIFSNPQELVEPQEVETLDPLPPQNTFEDDDDLPGWLLEPEPVRTKPTRKG